MLSLAIVLAVATLTEAVIFPLTPAEWAPVVQTVVYLALVGPALAIRPRLLRLFRAPTWQYAVACVLVAIAFIFAAAGGEAPTHVAVRSLFLLVVAAAEELIFRGFLWWLCTRVTDRGWLIVVLTTVCFALFHLPGWVVHGTDVVSVLAILIGGAIYGVLRLATGNLVLATFLHWAVDISA